MHRIVSLYSNYRYAQLDADEGYSAGFEHTVDLFEHLLRLLVQLSTMIRRRVNTREETDECNTTA